MSRVAKDVKFIKTLFYFLAIFIFFFALGEILYRILDPHYQIYERTHPGQYKNIEFAKNLSWPQYDQGLGWVCNTEHFTYGSDNISYKINKQGFRDDKDFTSPGPRQDKKRIMILGDSFIFGTHLESQETFPSLLQENLRDKYVVFNLGIPGWGIDQMFLAYKKYDPRIKPNIVIFCFIDDDIFRVFESFRKVEMMRKPSFEIKKGKLALRKEEKIGLWPIILKTSRILNRCHLIYRSYYSKKITEAIFLEMIQETQLAKEKFIVIRIPTRDDMEFSSWSNKWQKKEFSFRGLFKKKNVLYLELYDYMKSFPSVCYAQLYVDDVGHLTRAANELIVNYILRSCNF